MGAPLEGLRVIELDNALTGAQAGQMLADFGAEVVLVEPPGGSVLRSHPSWPLWGRGKRSVALDLSQDEGRAAVRGLAVAADVLIESFRPGTADRLGLGYRELSRSNPRLVYMSITGWGSQGPYRDAPGYEGLVLAKLGEMWSYWQMTGSKRPAFISTPYASVSATHTALHGILAALTERERSGAGQRAETSLAQAVGALDPWSQALHMITSRFPDAFSPGYPYDDEGNPLTSFASALLVAMTSDGYWMQFSQVQPRLFRGMLEELGLQSLLEDPYWAGIPNLDSMQKRIELLELLQREVRRKSLAEWQEIFDRNENVFAETFRQGTELLHHPQVVHDGNAVVVEDPRVGPVLQPAPPVWIDKAPAPAGGPAPLLDADRAVLGSWPPGPASPATAVGDAPPLAGLTIVELGSFYAAPYGATVLTDLGARVIKIEETTGDHFRQLIDQHAYRYVVEQHVGRAAARRVGRVRLLQPGAEARAGPRPDQLRGGPGVTRPQACEQRSVPVVDGGLHMAGLDHPRRAVLIGVQVTGAADEVERPGETVRTQDLDAGGPAHRLRPAVPGRRSRRVDAVPWIEAELHHRPCLVYAVYLL